MLLVDQHHAEACFSMHHVSVSLGSLFKRHCLDHRAKIFQDAEGEGTCVLLHSALVRERVSESSSFHLYFRRLHVSSSAKAP
jgi:hypothetical protein